mmetsp:Transcript_111890/g.361231  ORF Transcript_111890/g.361231 Transcript_111890/m.361231 type:complete len:414 (+) Transcript_111890:1331-2572(+)
MEPPHRARSVPATCTSRIEASSGTGVGLLKSGVMVSVTSGQLQYREMVSSPGDLHSSPSSVRAAMESESLPPSMLTPKMCMISRNANAVSYIRAPSPGSLLAHIQLPSALMSPRSVHLAQTMFVIASATDIRALAAPERRPLMGCSPMAVTPPLTGSPSGVSMEWAMTAQSESGVSSGPTHCCCAMRPVTLRSTLFVRKRLEPTVTLESTSLSVVAKVTASHRMKRSRMTAGLSAANLMSARLERNVLGGSLPKTCASGSFTGVELSRLSTTVQSPSPVMLPTQQTCERSRLATSSNMGKASSRTSMQLLSWYSAPQISSTDIVGSPTTMLRMSILPPTGSRISLSTLQLPPQPWSCNETMGLRLPSSQQARMTRFIFCSISASPRCTALKSRSERLSPSAREEAEPPPMPMR